MPFTNQTKNTSTFSNQGESLNSYDLLIDATYFLNIGEGFHLNLETEIPATWSNQNKNT